MIGPASTTFSIYRGTEFTADGDEADVNTTPAASGIPGSISRKKFPLVYNEASYTPREVNWYTARVPRRHKGQTVTIYKDDRLKDEKSGEVYLVDTAAPEPGMKPAPDQRVDLKKIN